MQEFIEDEITKKVARRILRLGQRTNRAELLDYIKRLPKSVGLYWESVGDDTFLIVPGFVSVEAPGEPSEFPVPMRVVLDETDAPMAMLRMWADRVLGEEQEMGPADNNCGLGAEDVDPDADTEALIESLSDREKEILLYMYEHGHDENNPITEEALFEAITNENKSDNQSANIL